MSVEKVEKTPSIRPNDTEWGALRPFRQYPRTV